MRLQRALLRRAVDAVRPGGRVVYATCTFAPEENEAVVADILAERGGGLEIVPCAPPGLSFDPGLASWNGRRFPPALRHAVRIWPHRADTGGFFCVVLRRIGNGAHRAATKPPPGVAFDHPSVRDEVGPVLERFGVPISFASSWRYRRASDRYVTVACEDHDPGVPFEILSSGLSAIRARGIVPRPTTQGSIALGPWITRSCVDIGHDEGLAFVSRRSLPLDRPAEGHQVVRWRGFSLGVGFARPGGSSLESLHPKSWAGLRPPGQGV